jgi:hypothetical protein
MAGERLNYCTQVTIEDCAGVYNLHDEEQERFKSVVWLFPIKFCVKKIFN